MKTMTVQESMERARTSFRIGDYAQAEALVLGVLERKKRLPEVHNFLGTVYGRMGTTPGPFASSRRPSSCAPGTRKPTTTWA